MCDIQGIWYIDVYKTSVSVSVSGSVVCVVRRVITIYSGILKLTIFKLELILNITYPLFEYYVSFVWILCILCLNIAYPLFEYDVSFVWIWCILCLNMKYPLFEYYVYIVSISMK